MATKQDAAVNFANQLINLMAQERAHRQVLNDFVQQYNSENYSAIWSALPTAAQNADGTLGTPDGSPTAGHPIDTRAVTALQRAIPASTLTAVITYLQNLQKLLTNIVPTQGNYNQTIDDAAG